MIDTAKMRYACENWRRPGPGYGAGEIFANLPEMLDELDAARARIQHCVAYIRILEAAICESLKDDNLGAIRELHKYTIEGDWPNDGKMRIEFNTGEVLIVTNRHGRILDTVYEAGEAK